MPATRTLEQLTIHWQWALDSAAAALAVNDGSRRRVVPERREVAALLDRVAAVHGLHVHPWLAPGPVDPRMLGLPATTRAVIFDLDGVLTNSATLHATAWAEALDPFLLDVGHHAGWPFVPFDRATDYPAYFDGRTRLEGLRLFLAGRGLSVDDGAIVRLGETKGRLLERGLHSPGIGALPDAQRYLHAAGLAHLSRAVVSASTSTLPMLERSELAAFVDVRVDAEDIRTRGLRSRPAPDLLLAACDGLGVDPRHAVSLTRSSAGIQAATALSMPAISVLSLTALLDARLRAA